ncbi:MAG: dTDP-glucose pyrophosphorylase [Saprospiraceae bacterium]|jgi:dTDP-glucose pyrophosphorylase
MKPTLVVLAAGMGSRYGGLKQLDGVGPAEETIIDFSVYDAIRAGFGKVVFIVRESFVEDFKEKVSSRFADLIEVAFVFQPMEPDIPGLGVVPRQKPWGTGHAMLVAKDVVKEPFAVINADDYYGISSFKIMADFLNTKVTPTHFSMAGFQLSKTLSPNGSVSRGVCEMDAESNLTSVVERTKIVIEGDKINYYDEEVAFELSENTLVSMNFWGFHPEFFKDLETHFINFAKAYKDNPRSEFYIPLIINDLVQSGKVKVEVLESTEQWYGVTYAEDKPKVQKAILGMIDQGSYENPLWKK